MLATPLAAKLGSGGVSRFGPRSADGGQWDMLLDGGSRTSMGPFLLGLIIGFGGALALFIYNEGDLFLKLSQQVKQAAQRFKQSS